MEAKQETTTARATVMVTPEEKEDIRLVAAFDRTTESDLLRPALRAISRRATDIRAGRAISKAA